MNALGGSADDWVHERSSLRTVDRSPAFAGFVLYVFVITTYQLGLGDAGMILALVGLPFLRGGVRFPLMTVGALALLIWAGVGYLATDYPAAVGESLITLAKLFLILLVAVNVLGSRPNIRFFLLFFVLSYVLYPARGTIINYLSGYTIFGRALWNFIYSNSNDLAAITLLVVSIAAGILVTEKRRSVFWWGALAATLILPTVILMTKSRGVFLGLVVFGVFATLGNRQRLKSIGIAICFCIAILIMAPEGVLDRLGGLRNVVDRDRLSEVDQEGSAEQRYKIWEVTTAIIADHPLMGVGWGAYALTHEQYAPQVHASNELSHGPRDAHSTYLKVIAEVGYPGFLLFAGIVGGVLAYAERARRRVREVIPKHAQQLYFLELGLVGFLIAGIFASYAGISFLYLHLAIMYAVARACELDVRALYGRDGTSQRMPMTGG